MSARDEQGVAEVLAEHYLYVNMRDIGCNCGVRCPDNRRQDRDLWHREHLTSALIASPEFAQIIADAKAEHAERIAQAIERANSALTGAGAPRITFEHAARIARAAALTEDARGEG